MIFELAPMEGFTFYTYRNVLNRHFPSVDRYYTPFISANESRSLMDKEKRDIDPQNNEGLFVVPQILAKDASQFASVAKTVQSYGYDEINLNFGCPSGTVVSKGKGAGMLRDPEKLHNFLDEAFALLDGSGLKISVKTRLGIEDEKEAEKLIKVYNDFNLSELIIHPRVRKEFYKNDVHLHQFGEMLKESRNPVTYNGDICGRDDYDRILELFPSVERVMIGRGVIINPALIRELKGGDRITITEYEAFITDLCDAYYERTGIDRNVLHKMKDFWAFMAPAFDEGAHYVKAIRKSRNIDEYRAAVKIFFSNCQLIEPRRNII